MEAVESVVEVITSHGFYSWDIPISIGYLLLDSMSVIIQDSAS